MSDKPAPSPVKKSDDGKTSADLHELEKYGGELATKAITAFHDAACAVQDYNKDVISVVESADATVGNQIWDRYISAY